jgi:hypothetical protein
LFKAILIAVWHDLSDVTLAAAFDERAYNLKRATSILRAAAA